MAEPKKKPKRTPRQYKEKACYAYINADGSQYLDADIAPQLKIESPPKELNIFRWTMGVQNVAQAQEWQDTQNDLLISEGMGQNREPSQAEILKGEKIGRKISREEIISTIGTWGYVIEAGKESEEGIEDLPVDDETWLSLEPSWLGVMIKSSFDQLNRAKNWRAA